MIQKPNKPCKGFPLFAHDNGQWCKKVKRRPYYFGRWADDPKGETALRKWISRKDGIFAGLDGLRVEGNKGSVTVGQLRKEFLETKATQLAAKELSPVTYADYIYELARFVKKIGESAEVAALRPEHFAAYNRVLITERKLGRHARKRVIAYCKAMLNWGAGNGRSPLPVFGTAFKAPDTSPDAIRQAKARAGEIDNSQRIVTGGEIDRMLAACHPQFRAIILLGINCGLGPADIGRLRWCNINMATGKLDMPRGKTGTPRVGYLWKRTRKSLMRVAKLKRNAEAIANDGPDALVFVTRTGKPFYREVTRTDGNVKVEQAISGPINKLVRSLGLTGVSFYRFRHSFASLAVKGRDREAVDLAMGHADHTMGRRYMHVEFDFRRIKRVAKIVYRQLWPKPREKPQADETIPTTIPPIRIAG